MIKICTQAKPGERLPVESCLLEVVDLQGDKILQYSFLRAPRGEKSKIHTFTSVSYRCKHYFFSLSYYKQVCGEKREQTKEDRATVSETVQ